MNLKKIENREKLCARKDEVLAKFDTMLTTFIESENRGEYKQAANLVYWLDSFQAYIAQKNNFNPNRLIRYNRGQVIKVNFGFNVGHEEGGLHYAIVVDNRNKKSSGLITVIPLTSIKFDERGDIKNFNKNYDIKLDSDLYEKILEKSENHLNAQRVEYEKCMKIFQQIINFVIKQYGVDIFDMAKKGLTKEDVKEKIMENMRLKAPKAYVGQINNKKNSLKVMDSSCRKEKRNKVLQLVAINQKSNDYMKGMIDECLNSVAILKENLRVAEKIRKEVDKMKEGSIALVGQITTVSKQRIYDPRTMGDVFPGIKISSDKMDEINKKIKELYIYE